MEKEIENSETNNQTIVLSQQERASLVEYLLTNGIDEERLDFHRRTWKSVMTEDAILELLRWRLDRGKKDQENIPAAETFWDKLGVIGREKDRIIGALHYKIACWGAGFLHYHLGIVWDGFGRYAISEKNKGRARFRSYLENKDGNPPLTPG